MQYPDYMQNAEYIRDVQYKDKMLKDDYISTTRGHASETFIQDENDLDIDEGNRRICKACTLPIFSTPYETDADGHFFHRCCLNLPKKITGHPLHPRPLRLRSTPRPLPICFHRPRQLLWESTVSPLLTSYPYPMNALFHQQSSTLEPDCYHCRRKCREGFFYECPDMGCIFILHILCALTSIKIVHRSHNHKLVRIHSKSNLFTCGVCGLKKEDEFYRCDFCDFFCNFYLHRDCASLPNTIRYSKHEQHPLSLTYVVPENSFIFQKSKTCSICHEELSSIKSGMYFCLSCNYNAHVKCIILEPTSYKSESSQNVVGDLVHLPMPDERTSLLRHLLEHKIDHNSNSNSIGATKEEKKLLRKEIHSHTLILIDDEYGDGTSDQLCNVCIQPISSPYYTCVDPQCNNIYFHNCCINLPLQLCHPAHKRYSEKYSKDCRDDRPLRLLPRLSSKFFSMFTCDSCGQPCNGFVYSCDECPFKLDVKCAFLPEAITYEGHGKAHILFFSWYRSRYDEIICNCCGEKITNTFYYECGSCLNLKLHACCALLPSSVSHRFDRHPLKLSTLKDEDRDFCEICEEGVVRYYMKSWLYHCEECATSFHIDCIPCVAQYSKIKFGGTIRVQCHDCPLTSIRTLTSYNYECGVCKSIIQSRENERHLLNPYCTIAFECIKCCFWLCWNCADKYWVEEE